MNPVLTSEEVLESRTHINVLVVLDSLYSALQTPLPLNTAIWAIRGVASYKHKFSLDPDISLKFAVLRAVDDLKRLGLLHKLEGGIIPRPSKEIISSSTYTELKEQATSILSTLRLI